jgi:putative LysE/RhtB family amino acid efflux pump
MHSWIVGFGLGFLVAMQLGPMSLLLIRCTLRGGWRVGAAVGAGIAIVDGLYAACGAAGAAPLLAVAPLRVTLAAAGAVVLVALGARTLWSAMRVRSGGETTAEVATPRRAFATALAGTASNPATIASWAAIFAAADTIGAGSTTAGAVLLVAGIAVGSLTWVTLLASAVALARRAAGERALRAADAIAGVGMLGFGVVLGYGAAHDR